MTLKRKGNERGLLMLNHEGETLLTVKEYAEKAEVTQQAVYKRLTKGLAPFVVEVDGQKYIKQTALDELAARLQRTQNDKIEADREEESSPDSAKLLDTLNRTIEILQGQLAVKDEQIKDLNARLEQALNNTSQSHFIAAQAQTKALEGETHGEAEEAATSPAKAKKSIFARIFGR